MWDPLFKHFCHFAHFFLYVVYCVLKDASPKHFSFMNQCFVKSCTHAKGVKSPSLGGSMWQNNCKILTYNKNVKL